MSFIKYQHLEKWGTQETDGINVGKVYVFPKLDGTNGSLWLSNGAVCAGSRNRQLSHESDNAGFFNDMVGRENVQEFFNIYDHLTLYGEWLVPHSFKDYRDDAWRRFYVFDVYDQVKERLLAYDEYADMLRDHGFNVISPIAIINNGDYDSFVRCHERNNYLLKDGTPAGGEGIVLKNYDFKNQYGRQTWAKIIRNEFKEMHISAMGADEIGGKIVEEQIVDKYVDKHLVDKTYAKITMEMDGWHSKLIPRLLMTVWYDFINEETFSILKEFKNPKIDFKILNHFVIAKIKQLKPELF